MKRTIQVNVEMSEEDFGLLVHPQLKEGWEKLLNSRRVLNFGERQDLAEDL